MRTLLANRKLLKRKLVDIENHIRGSLRTYGLLVGAVGRGGFEARVRELVEHSDYVFSAMIGAMWMCAGRSLKDTPGCTGCSCGRFNTIRFAGV